MVTIVNYHERLKDDGTSFCVLEIQGGIEMVQSKTTGMFYATAKRAIISSTFDVGTCHGLIGTQIPGEIKREECEPYEYVIKDTGEEIVLAHRWVYVPENSDKSSHSEIKPESTSFSENGIAHQVYA